MVGRVASLVVGPFVRTKPATGGTAASRPTDKTAGQRLTYLPGVDGLRALAVLAVLLYHAELPWIGGGFLGVDVFFVISGYLITSLLLAEWSQRGHIDMPAFWLRRARRLLPALFLLMAVTLIFAIVALSSEVAGLRDDALAALGYATNWYLIFSHQSYFEMMGRPSLFRHLWSLAVEEQFYIVWPLLLSAMLWLWRPRYVLLAVLAGAVASTVLMALLYQPDADPSRVYYGTDTRGVGLLAGAALAFVWAPGKIGGRARVHPLAIDVAGLSALGVLFYTFLRLDGHQSFLYQGGFALVAVASAGVIAAVVHPRGHLGWVLGRQPLRWLGLRSYGVYLWHWPVFMLTRPDLDVPFDGLPLLALRFGVTLTIAELSYRLVETPIRAGALGRVWRAFREAEGALRWRLRCQWAAAASASLVAFAVVGMSVAGAERPGPPSYLAVETIHIVLPAAEPHDAATTFVPAPTATATARPKISTIGLIPPARKSPAGTPQPTTTPTPGPVVEAAADPPPQPTTTLEPAPALPAPATEVTTEPTPAATAAPPPTTPPDTASAQGSPALPSGSTPPDSQVQPASTPAPPAPTPAPGAVPTVRVTAIGDSVMLGAATTLAPAIGNIEVDAEVGRQVSTAIDILKAYRDAGRLGDVVVVHMGNNGTFSAGQFDEMMQVLANVRRVVFVNLKEPRDWEGPNNTVIAQGVARYPNTVLVDWHTASVDRPDFFWDDAIHLRPEGAQYYAQLIAAFVGAP
jgi:peptidoglycan/LPS O-acetylase OafA/YrhL